MSKLSYKLYLFLLCCVMSLTATASVLSIITKNKADTLNPPTNNSNQITHITDNKDDKDDKPVVESSNCLTIQVSSIINSEKIENKETLEKVIIENNAVIKAGAFKDCVNLKELHINVNARVEAGAFEGVNLEEVYITGVGEIDKVSFENLNLNPANENFGFVMIFENFNGYKVTYKTSDNLFKDFHESQVSFI